MKLTLAHSDNIKNLFTSSDSLDNQLDIASPGFINVSHEIFQTNYLGQLNNWHSFADENLTTAIVCYQSQDEASWYLTHKVGNGDITHLISEAIEYNQNCNLFKFYMIIPTTNLDTFSLGINEYDYFDEMIVPKKTRCYYSTIWQLLYQRVLPTEDTIVRCYYLKKEYRKTINIAGTL